MNEQVWITEVGPRDGLQNEQVDVPTEAKVNFVDALVKAGIRQIEVTSFVHPRRVPRMADAETVFGAIKKKPGVRFIALVPNLRGYERAVAAECGAVALFTAASDDFTRRNINMTIEESLSIFREIQQHAERDDVQLRGYVSTIFACPFSGPVEPGAVLDVAQRLLDIGCYEISLGDTIGVGTPVDTRRLLDVLLPKIDAARLVLHFHDTWGMAVANVVAALDYGIRRFDSSAGGLGGCPYAPSASGNLASEDLVYLLNHLGYHTGIDLEKMVRAGRIIAQFLDHPLQGKVHQAVVARWKRSV